MPGRFAIAIFDLDNCLCDARAVGPACFDAAFDAIRRANDGAVPADRLQQAFDDCWFSAFSLVAARHRFTPAMVAAGFEAFAALTVDGPLRGYDDLAVLPDLDVRRMLVTSGFRRLQESKLAALGIGPWFEQVIIDAVDGDHPGKQAIFERIVTREGLDPAAVLVVGDNPLSELQAGKALGMRTVQTLRPNVHPAGIADHRIHRLDELKPILARGW